MSKDKNTVSSFKYKNIYITPDGYKCSKCGATMVKLWRNDTFLDQQILLCFDCCNKLVVNNPKSPFLEKWHGTDKFTVEGYCSMVPAVPTEEGDTYWSYTSVPALGCIWWRSLNGPHWSNEALLKDYDNYILRAEVLLTSPEYKKYLKYYEYLVKSTNEAIEVMRQEILFRMTK